MSSRVENCSMTLHKLDTVKYPSKIGNADDRLVDLCVNDNSLQGYDSKGLKADVATRWASVCRLFESAANSYEVFNEVLLKIGSYEHLLDPREVDEIRITAKQYRAILDLMMVLQSSAKPSINMVVLGVIDIEANLLKFEDEFSSETRDTGMKFNRELAQQLRQCVSGRMRPFHRVELFGPLLDPEMKQIPKIRAEVPGGDVIKFLLDAIYEYTTIEESDDDIAIVPESPIKKQRSSLINKYTARSHDTETVSSEVARYLALPVKLSEMCNADEADKVLQWWSRNATIFPRVSELVRIVLPIPATSAEPERRFSSAGNVLREKRCSMDPSTMSKTLFIHDNRKFL